MAKMKVYELAQEMGLQSKDILTALKNKGIEVKSHMSVLEDGQVEDLKNSLKAPAKSEETPKAAEADKKEQPADAKAPVKKKKSIIFVSNPHNSKMPGAQIPRKPAHQEKKAAPAPAQAAKAAEPVKAAAKPVETSKAAEAPVKAAEPVNTTVKAETKPEIVKPVETAPAPETPKAAPAPQPKAETAVEAPKATEAPAQDNRAAQTSAPRQQSGSQDRNSDRNQDRRQGYNNGSRQYDNQRRSDNNNYQRRDGGQQRSFDGNGNRRDGGQQRSFDGNRRDGGQQRSFDGNRRDGGQRNNDGNRRPFDPNRQNARPGQGFGGNRGGFNKDDDRRDNNRGGFGGKQGGRPGQKSNNFVPDSPIKDAEKHRDEEKRRISQEKDKKNRKDLMYEEDGDMQNIKGKNKPGKFIKPEKKPVEQVEEQIKVITLPETLTIKELADKMKIQPSAIVKKLFMQGQIVTVNQEISYETAENIAIDYDIICEKEVKVDVIEELLKEDEEKEEDMVKRPPVICVMGHVDHGKTSLLDAIRKTNVTDKEAGGITQHIGAYTVNVNGEKITFLDTPGHEAFTAMRMRGANSTDIAILVVAADDGVMPQTVEAINHAKAAGIEIIVAINKIDKESANIDRVKQELMEYELVPEDWGGSTIFCPVSAHTKEGIDNLLEMIILTAEILELKANKNRKARGIVIEAQLDKGRGSVATILVQKGTLHVGDCLAIGDVHGKVRAMFDDKGRKVKEATPSMPVEVLGLNGVPNSGEIVIATENEKEARTISEAFINRGKEKLIADTKQRMSLDDLYNRIQEGNVKDLNLIIKADVQGSVEAVKQSLLKLSNEEVAVKCIHSGVGAINESDVILASASNAIIIGFNIRPDNQAKEVAEREKVDIRLYRVIYNAIEDIESAMKGMLDPIFEEKVIGHAEVRQTYKASGVGTIAGSYVLDGTIQRNCKVRISREGEQIFEGELASLKRFKDDVKEVKTGFECGLVMDGFNDIKEGDIIEAYIMVEVPR